MSGTPEAQPGKKAPAAKKSSPASQPAAKQAAPRVRQVKSGSGSGSPSSDSKPAKKATAKKVAVAAKRPATAKALAASSESTTSRTSPKKRSSSGRAEVPTERDVMGSRFFVRARKRAEKVLSDPEKMRGVAAQASSKSQGSRSGPLSDILDEVGALARLVVAYARGTYREVSGQSMVLILAGLIYFISPADLIPDVLPVVGHMDDAVVLAFVIRTVRDELEAFMAWETGHRGASSGDAATGDAAT